MLSVFKSVFHITCQGFYLKWKSKHAGALFKCIDVFQTPTGYSQEAQIDYLQTHRDLVMLLYSTELIILISPATLSLKIQL